MDYSTIVSPVFYLLYLIPVFFIIGFFKSATFKGWVGEKVVHLVIHLGLKQTIYHPIHNVTLPTEDGSTQIDTIIVSPFGIFVIEVKNYKGWIFGNEKQKRWTQQIYKVKHSFQNPLHQNYKHVKVLEHYLNIPADNIVSVVVFVGDSVFKTPMPDNVIRVGKLLSWIKRHNEKRIDEEAILDTIKQIEQIKLEPSLKTNWQHRKNIKAKSSRQSTRSTETKICQRCGSAMMERTAKQGANAGNRFWGCSNFPKCRYTENL